MVRKISVQHDENIDSSPQKPALKLPIQVLTVYDVARLVREAEKLEEFFTRGAVTGAKAKDVPQLSRQMELLVENNQLNVLHKEDRASLVYFLNELRSNAPVVHLSFATEPKPEFLSKLMNWFRVEAHPHILFKIGLRPAIAAGCIVRTNNKYFDFSFKQRFSDSKGKLAQYLGAGQ